MTINKFGLLTPPLQISAFSPYRPFGLLTPPPLQISAFSPYRPFGLLTPPLQISALMTIKKFGLSVFDLLIHTHFNSDEQHLNELNSKRKRLTFVTV